MTTRRARGFSLIELMVTTAIVAALASVAIPSFLKLSLRAKVAERALIMARIRQQIQDYYLRNGSAVPASSGGSVASGFNPPRPASPLKRAMSTAMPVWNAYFSAGGGGSDLATQIEGSVYYSYAFEVTDTGRTSTIRIYAVGDLDGDGIESWRYTFYDRSDGAYHVTTDFPPPGLEDEATYGSF